MADLDAVLGALQDGTLTGAAIDVLPWEPPPPEHALLRHSRALLSPHAAFYSEEAVRELRSKAVWNILA